MSRLSLKAHGLSFAHSSAAPVLEDVHLHLTPGFYGLVGANGAGKTTLLRLFNGELEPEAGVVQIEPEGARVTICAQTVDEPSPEILAFAADDGREARLLREKLALDPADLGRWPTLSPGERKRFQIGAALLESPEVLLLDEPTNHLDEEGRNLLIAALRRFRGITIVVSHDRALLDTLTRATLRIRRAKIDHYPAPYSEAREAWQQEEQSARERVEMQKDRAKSIERRLGEVRRERDSAERSLNAKSRMKNKNDTDAASMGNKMRAEWAEARIGRNVGVVRAELERAKEAITPIEVDKTLGRSVFVEYARAKSPRLFSLDEAHLRAGDRVVLRDVRIWIDRDDRIHLAGPNGAGKTTLLRALLANAKVPPEKLLFVPQDVSADEGRVLLDTITALPPRERGRVLSLVAALGVDPDRLLASRKPSPGETRKAMIALGLGRHVWALLLDEPTNHLDLPSIERLEAALEAYPGALLLVTHDVSFAKKCTSTSWRIENERITVESAPREACGTFG